ncbi:MAG: hypothetical protein ACJ75B_12180 [Flavisolibacter sp.]
MQKNFFTSVGIKIFLTLFILSVSFACKKDTTTGKDPQINEQNTSGANAYKGHDEDEDEDGHHGGVCPTNPPYDLNVILKGAPHGFGFIVFRQDPDPARIATLDTWVFGLQPNQTYRLQRAVDVLDCNCTSTNWLTLGTTTGPLVITTDAHGLGHALFSRDVSGFPPGTAFDIHWQIVDAANNVVLTSQCRQFTIR